MARSSSYAVAFGAGFAAATLLLTAAGWLKPKPPAAAPEPAFVWPPAAPAVTAAPPGERDAALLAHCRARLAALLGQYPLTFERRSGELRPETLPLLHGIAEISADCPAAALVIALPDDGADPRLRGARNAVVRERLGRLGVPTSIAPAPAPDSAPVDFAYVAAAPGLDVRAPE